jgi:hypothetical protein
MKPVRIHQSNNSDEWEGGEPVNKKGSPWLGLVGLLVIPLMVPLNILAWRLALGL